jgi:Alpha/beta hydrolase of unknown function (DUF1400)
LISFDHFRSIVLRRKSVFQKCIATFASLLSLVSLSSFADAKRITLRLGVIEMYVPTAELQTLADTGEAKGNLAQLLKLAKVSPDQIAGTINFEIYKDAWSTMKMLDSEVGQILLNTVGRAIQTPKNVANAKALSSAIILSAADDERISLLDILAKYPFGEIVVDIPEAQKLMKELGELLPPQD